MVNIMPPQVGWTVSGAPPPLTMVMVRKVLVPRVTSPRSIIAGVTVTAGADEEVPLSGTVKVPLLVVTTRSAV